MKKTKYKEGECPFYQPSCQNIELWTLISKLKSKYDFHYTLSNFKRYSGSLGSVLKTLYAQRLEEWVSDEKNEIEVDGFFCTSTIFVLSF